jgi:hypothetical protein
MSLMAFIDLKTSHKLAKYYMHRKKSQNHDSLRKPFENIIIFGKTFSEHLETIIKAETQDKTVLDTKEHSLPQN